MLRLLSHYVTAFTKLCRHFRSTFCVLSNGHMSELECDRYEVCLIIRVAFEFASRRNGRWEFFFFYYKYDNM